MFLTVTIYRGASTSLNSEGTEREWSWFKDNRLSTFFTEFLKMFLHLLFVLRIISSNSIYFVKKFFTIFTGGAGDRSMALLTLSIQKLIPPSVCVLGRLLPH